MISSKVENKIEKTIQDSFTKPLSSKIDEIKNKHKEMEKLIFYKRKIFPLPPFNFTLQIISGLENVIDDKLIDETNVTIKAFTQLLKDLTNKDTNKYFRLVNIDSKLMNLVEHTENEIFYRHLPIPTMFINNEVWYENKIIKGITVVDLEFYKNFTVEFKDKVNIEFEGNENYFIFFFMIDKINYEISYDFFTLNYDMGNSNIDLKEYLRMIICNTIDMMYSMDEKLDVVSIETSRDHNIKREKRGQIPTPTQIFIKPNNIFKKYVNKFDEDLNKGTLKKTGQYIVKGHWRHFRADRYKEETKKHPIFIAPYFKGEGIMIAKEYMITK